MSNVPATSAGLPGRCCGLALGFLSRGLVWLLVLSAGGLCAQPAASPPAPPSNRYLLIVDTSRDMEARERAMLKVVEELLNSGISGQMKAGDTLGVWTYNADLYAGRFPLQRWSPYQQKAITARLVKFLKGQKFEKAAELDKVLAAMEGVVKGSHLITLILVSAGDGVIQGTPFDDRINEFWRRWHDKQKAAKMPFVIVLRAREGEIENYTLNTPPWPVQMPFLPAETELAASPPQEAVPKAPPNAQPPVAQPLMVSDKKSKPLQAPKAEEAPTARAQPAVAVATNEPVRKESPPAPPAATQKVEAARVETPTAKVEQPAPAPAAITNTPTPVKADQPKPAAPATEMAKAEPKPVAPPKPAPEPPPTQTPPVVQAATPSPAPTPKAETAKAPAEKPPEAVPAQPPAPLPPPAPKAESTKAPEPTPAPSTPVQVAAASPPPASSKPAPAVVEPPKPALEPKAKVEAAATPPAPRAAPPAATVVVPTTRAAAAPPPPTPRPLPSVSPAAAQEASAVPAKPSPAPEKRAEPAAAPGPAREVTAAPSGAVTNAAPALAVTSSNLPASPPSPIAPVQTAVAAPAESFLSQKTTWIAGILLLGVACGFGWLALRRARATPHASLITRSLDRNKRP